MRCTAPTVLIVLAALLPGAAAADIGLSSDRAGLGLKSDAPAWSPTDGMFGLAAAQTWDTLGFNDYSLYGGGREAPMLGLRAAEAYAGIVYSGTGWGSSLEASHAHASALAPASFALAGQVHTALSAGRTLSVGLKYRVYDTDPGLRYGLSGDMPGNGYTLARTAGYAPSYQLQMSYQHSAASAFGLALGREVETFTPFHDPSGSGPRQLSFTGQHWLTQSWALSYDVLSQDVASPLRLHGLRLGVRYRW